MEFLLVLISLLNFSLLHTIISLPGSSAATLETTSTLHSNVTDTDNAVIQEVLKEVREDQESKNLSNETEPDRISEIFKPNQIIDFTIPEFNKSEDLLHWKPPQEFVEGYPYYLSGFDKKNQPIWVSEFGKFALSSALRDNKTKEIFKKYCRQAVYLGVKSHELRSTPEHPVTRHSLLIDWEGQKFSELSNVKAIQFLTEFSRAYRRYFEKNVDRFILVNVNFLTENLTNLLRPFYGRLLDRIEIYGTNRNRWIPQILKHFPKDQIPEWYGGSAGHKPIVVHG